MQRKSVHKIFPKLVLLLHKLFQEHKQQNIDEQDKKQQNKQLQITK